MNDGVGVCTICAKVCHKDHDISYAKYGSFFCDCGAKEDGSCTVSVVPFNIKHLPKMRMLGCFDSLCYLDFITYHMCCIAYKSMVCSFFCKDHLYWIAVQ